MGTGTVKPKILTKGPVVTANGEPLSILDQTRCKISLAGTDFIYEVLVANDVSQDCLLGANFSSAHGFTIELKNYMCYLAGQCQPLSYRPRLCPHRAVECPSSTLWWLDLKNIKSSRLLIPIFSIGCVGTKGWIWGATSAITGQSGSNP